MEYVRITRVIRPANERYLPFQLLSLEATLLITCWNEFLFSLKCMTGTLRYASNSVHIVKLEGIVIEFLSSSLTLEEKYIRVLALLTFLPEAYQGVVDDFHLMNTSLCKQNKVIYEE